VQGWIVETGHTASGVIWGRDREDVRLKVRVTRIGDGDGMVEVECWPGGFVFVAGVVEVREGEGEVRVLLAGQGGARGSGGVRIKVGSLVGIRAPVWDVDVRREVWSVGVDWVVL
jgi:hypothetical protein